MASSQFPDGSPLHGGETRLQEQSEQETVVRSIGEDNEINLKISQDYLTQRKTCLLPYGNGRVRKKSKEVRRLMKELDKTYNPSEIEGRIYDKWMEKKIFFTQR